jgi:hypothetical protein
LCTGNIDGQWEYKWFFLFLLPLNDDLPKVAGQWEDGQLKVNQVCCFLKNQSFTRSVLTKTFVENPQDNVNRVLLS